MPASLLCAAPRIPAITWEETSKAYAISKAEWGRWQPSPKYRRITFSCRGGSLRRISDMRFRSIWATSFQNTRWIASLAERRGWHSKTESTRPEQDLKASLQGHVGPWVIELLPVPWSQQIPAEPWVGT